MARNDVLFAYQGLHSFTVFQVIPRRYRRRALLVLNWKPEKGYKICAKNDKQEQ